MLLVFRAQGGSEATDPFLCWANAFSVLQMCDGAACFAALVVLPVAPAYEGVCCGGALPSFARARELNDGRLAQSMSWTGHMHAILGCVITFLERESPKRARVSAPQWEWCLTCVQHV